MLEPLLPTDARGRGGRYLDPELIHRAFPQLGLPGISLLADRLEHLDTDHRHALDHSAIWRPAIGTDRHGDGRDLLVSALRDAAVAVAAADGSAGVVQLVDRHEPALFGRLALHVLTDVPDTDLVAERLTSRELFDNAEAFREYTLLLQHQFATLPTEIQQQVVRFIEAGPPRDGPPEAADRWRLRQLTRFGDALPADQQALHESLLERFGPPEDDDFEFLEFVGPTAPADAAALASMSDDDLLTMLATWTPDTHWRAPSREGLRLELEAAVQQDPARFAAVSPGFRDLDPTYGRGLLAGLTRAVSPGRASTRPGGPLASMTRPPPRPTPTQEP